MKPFGLFAFRFGKSRSDSRSTPRHRRSTGQSVVELALLLPVLMLILIGTLDLGRLLDAYVVMTNAAREGARYGAGHPTDIPGIENKTIAEAANSGHTITAAMVNVSVPNNTAGQPVNVIIDYPFTLVTTYIFGINTINVHATASMAILP